MESQVLSVRRSHGAAATPCQYHGSRFTGGLKRFSSVCPVPSSLGKQQWQFRVEKRLTLRPPRRTSEVEVRAKKPGIDFKLPGSIKLKKSEEEDGKETPSQNGTQKFGKLPGTTKLPGTVKLPGSQRVRRKDNNVVFVAGATGKVGRRVVKELVQLGYAVRAGVRDVEKAQFLVEFAAGIEKPVEEEEVEEQAEKKKPSLWANFAPEKLFGFLGSARKDPGVDLVEVDLESLETIEDAIGNAGVVVCAIGASEKEALNATAPYRIDYKATENLINAAIDAKVNHFVLVTSLGTQKIGWPAAALNLFWGVLVWKAKAEKALISSGIPFTIVRPGGMERPKDDYKETHNLLLDVADSRFGGQVSNLQVAELIGGIVSNLKLSQNKILEAVAETTAPLRTFEDLLAEIPSVDDAEAEKNAASQKISAKKAAEQEEKLAKREEAKAAKQREEEEKLAKKEEAKAAKRREEEERIAAEERAAAEQAKTEALRQKLQKQYSEAKEKGEEAKKIADEARLEKEVIENRVAELRSRIEQAAQAAKEAKAVEAAVLAVAREGKTLSEKEKRDIVAEIRAEAQAAAKEKAAKEKAAKEAEAKAKAAEEKAKKDAEAKAYREEEAARVQEKKKRKDEEARIVDELEQAAKAEAEKKAKAEADKKAKADAEKQAKAEAVLKAKAEAKEKDEAEAKAKAEAEEKAQAEAKANLEAEERAKLKEEEEKLKAVAEAKAKEEEEEKLKVEAEAKAKEEEKEKLKAEAVAKAKEEEEEKLKAEAEAKAKEDEEKIKAEAEAKPTEEAESKPVAEQVEAKEVQVVASGDVFAEKKAPKAFRWPWQKEPEAEETVDEPESGDVVAEEISEEKAEELPRTPKPLSPYGQYPDFKPPTSPTPSPPEVEKKTVDIVGEVFEKTTKEADKAKEAVVASIPEIDDAAKAAEEAEKAAEREVKRLAAQVVAEVKAREEQALEKAKATAATFRWPWQKPEPVEKETTSLPDTNSSSAPLSQSVTEQAVVSSSSTSELPRTNRPLSPYTRYPGLRPPSSPTPSPPVVAQVTKEVASNNGAVALTPPNSPPPPPSAKEESTSELVAKPAVEAAEEQQNVAPKAKFSWPWQKRELLPEEQEQLPEAEPSTLTTEIAAVVENTSLPQSSSTDLPRTNRPLSPYWRYPDLKPPTSPTPSAPRGKLEEKPVESSTVLESTPSEGQEVQETVTKVLETASAGSFRWPWQ